MLLSFYLLTVTDKRK